jgi:hypothetical protein
MDRVTSRPPQPLPEIGMTWFSPQHARQEKKFPRYSGKLLSAYNAFFQTTGTSFRVDVSQTLLSIVPNNFSSHQ